MRVLGIRDVTSAVSLSRSSIYRAIAAGTFPKPIRLTPGGHRVAWREEHICAWLRDPLCWPNEKSY